MSGKCVNHPDNFCHVYGEVTMETQQGSLTSMVRKCYEIYFGCQLGDQDKN